MLVVTVLLGYQVFGEGPPSSLFVGNWLQNLDVMWQEPSLARYFRRLASFSQVVCFDKRGSGISDPVPLDSLPPIEQWMDDGRVALDAAGVDRAAVIGDTEGGPMAMMMAAALPERPRVLSVTPLLREIILRLMRLPPEATLEEAGARLVAVMLDELQAGSEAPLHLPEPSDARLRRICAHYGADPTFVFSSATIGRPDELASAERRLDQIDQTIADLESADRRTELAPQARDEIEAAHEAVLEAEEDVDQSGGHEDDLARLQQARRDQVLHLIDDLPVDRHAVGQIDDDVHANQITQRI